MLANDARSICPTHMRTAYARTDGRTDEQKTVACVTNKSFRSVTRAHVGDFIAATAKTTTSTHQGARP